MTSTSINSRDIPSHGRLNREGQTGAWCTKEKVIKEDYLQVDMGAVHSVCAVKTQGPRGEVFTTSHKLQLSTDGVTWSAYKENDDEKVFERRMDQTGIIRRPLQGDPKARFVRFYPTSFIRWPCMAVEIFVLN
ncbi:lactadherin-like [Oculina patagonica]